MSTSLWLDPALVDDLDLPPLDGDITCDVVVIGGGLAGVAAARALAEARVDVVLLEGGSIGGGATGRNAGFILQGTAERYDRAVSRLGRERARRIHRWSLVNHDRMAAVIREDAIDCEYRRAGSLQLAGSAEEEAQLVRSAELLVEDGFEARLLSGDDLPHIYRAAGWRVGVLLPRDGELHPVRFVRGAAEGARRRGARLYPSSGVNALDASRPGDVRAFTERGTVSAALALVCTNAWARQLIPACRDWVDPVRGQMLATAPAPRSFEVPVYADHGYDYWRQTPGGRVVLGGWRNLDPGAEVGYEDRLHDGIQARMTAFLQRFPSLRGVAITHRWSGVMGFSRDGLPIVGPAPAAAGALLAAGFTGHGFGFAWLAGEALAAVALDGRHALADDLSPRRMN